MDYLRLYNLLFLAPLMLGLFFGLINFKLFTRKNQITVFQTKPILHAHILLGCCSLILSKFIFFRSLEGISTISSYTTNPSMIVLTVIVCLISSMFLFGFVQFGDDLLGLNQNDSKFKSYFNLVFGNLSTYWFYFNALILSCWISNSTINSPLIISGFVFALGISLFKKESI